MPSSWESNSNYSKRPPPTTSWAGIILIFAVFAALPSVAVAVAWSAAQLATAEAEAIWRMGFWANATWCAVDPKAPVQAYYASRVPFLLVTVLPNGSFVWPPTITASERWRKEDGYREWMEDRVSSYRAWRYASENARQRGLEGIVVTTGDECQPSSVLPVLAHCRYLRSKAHGLPQKRGLVLWPGLRHATEALLAQTEEAMAVDIPWHQKRNRAVWRGGTSGLKSCRGNADYVHAPCHPGAASRAHLVSTFSAPEHRELFDVGFSSVTGSRKELRNLTAGTLTLQQQLANKIVISVDGNTCSSALTWALSTNSVVAMVHPFKHEAPIQFALEPWVHFLPFSPDLGDLKKNILWCFNHDDDCRRLAERARRLVARLTRDKDGTYERLVQERILDTVADNMRYCRSPAAAVQAKS